jgi:hypothetical protein
MDSGSDDPVIDEIREIRHRISARFGHDPARLVAHYMELQKTFAGRFVKAPVATDHPDTPHHSGGSVDPRE